MRNTTPIKVLLVEDNPVDAMLLREYLTGDQYTVTHAERLEPAINRVKSEPFDVVLLDLSLPDSERGQTVPRMHAQAPQAAIVVLTGADDEDLGLAAVRVGAQDYLVKGQASTKVITRAIHYAMERKRGEIELRQSRDLLELRVRQRTAELERSVTLLGREISERADTETILRENELRLRGMIESMPAVFWICSPDLSATHFVTKSYAALWGRPCESLRTRPRAWMDSIHPQDRPRVEQSFRRWIEQAPFKRVDSLEMYFRIVRPDTSSMGISASIFAVYDERGGLQFICGRAEDAAQQRPSDSDDARIAVGPDARIRAWDAAAQRLFGYSPEQAVGQPVRLLVGKWARLKSWVRPRRSHTPFRIDNASPVKADP